MVIRIVKNDDIYVELEKEASAYVQGIGVEDNAKRKTQTVEEMMNEAASYRDTLDEMVSI